MHKEGLLDYEPTFRNSFQQDKEGPLVATAHYG